MYSDDFGHVLFSEINSKDVQSSGENDRRKTFKYNVDPRSLHVAYGIILLEKWLNP